MKNTRPLEKQNTFQVTHGFKHCVWYKISGCYAMQVELFHIWLTSGQLAEFFDRITENHRRPVKIEEMSNLISRRHFNNYKITICYFERAFFSYEANLKI